MFRFLTIAAASLMLLGCGGQHSSEKALAAARVTTLGGSVQFGPTTIVDLANTATTDSDLLEILNLPEVSELDLSNTQVTDAGLDALAGIRSLRCITLMGCQVTSSGVTLLKDRNPELKIMR